MSAHQRWYVNGIFAHTGPARQLRKRFGNQGDADIERRVEAASAEQIDVWAERVLSTTTLEDLLAG